MEKGGVPDKDIKLEMKQKVKSASFGKEGWREKGRHCTDFKIASGQFNMRRGTFVENIRSLKSGSWIMEFWDGVGSSVATKIKNGPKTKTKNLCVQKKDQR